MNILSLNTWGGRLEEEITAFITEQKKTVDVFCFQEVYPKMRTLCVELLPVYEEYYGYKFVTEPDTFHQAIYVRKTLTVSKSGVLFSDVPQTGFGVFVTVEQEGRSLTIVNYHGMSRPGDKLDTPERLTASEELIQHFSSKHKNRVIIGDFNLLNTAESVTMFEAHGYVDLIKKYRITNTRNKYAWEQHPNKIQYFADFAFLSNDLVEKHFEVLPDEVSDHAALLLKV